MKRGPWATSLTREPVPIKIKPKWWLKENKGIFFIFENWMVLIHLNSPSPKDALYKVWFLRRWFVKFVNICSLLSPLEKRHGLSFEQTLKYALCQVWVKMALWFLRKRFLKLVNVFLLFSYYLPLEMGGILHLKKLDPHHPRILCVKFGWNWPCGS